MGLSGTASIWSRESDGFAMGFVEIDIVAGKLSAAILEGLRTEIYGNRMMISPRRLREIAQVEEAAFAQFQQDSDLQAVRAHGHALALEGLGHRAMLRLTSALRHTCWLNYGAQTIWPEVSREMEDYASALLEGYMTGREADLKLEQQRTHDAYVRTLSQ